jgi:hypothetical protein
MQELSDLIRLMKTHELVSFIIPGYSQTALPTVAFADVIKQLEEIDNKNHKEEQ